MVKRSVIIPTLSGSSCPWYLPGIACDACADACKQAVKPAALFVLTVAALAIAGGAVQFVKRKS